MLALDEWRPCANPRKQQLKDGHASLPVTLENGDKTMRIAGRLFFTHKGKNTSYCYPFAYPDGTPMTDHLVHYYGASLFPVTVAYNGGWLAVLARQYPNLFVTDMALEKKNDLTGYTSINNFAHILAQMLRDDNNASFSESRIEEYLRLYAPRCGCAP